MPGASLSIYLYCVISFWEYYVVGTARITSSIMNVKEWLARDQIAQEHICWSVQLGYHPLSLTLKLSPTVALLQLSNKFTAYHQHIIVQCYPIGVCKVLV